MKTVKLANGVTYQFTEGHREQVYDWKGQPGAEPMYAADGGAMSKTTPGRCEMCFREQCMCGKVTPGPWRWTGGNLVGSDGFQVTYAEDVNEYRVRQTGEPNHRLIAAAPELLELVHCLADHLDQWKDDGDGEAAVTRARDLIRRIEEG